jgi:hypothetical protein
MPYRCFLTYQLCRYLIADYERMNFSISQCVFESGAKPNIITIESISAANSTSPESPSSRSPISSGAIGGIAVAVLVVILFTFFLWMRIKKKLLFKKAPVAKAAEELQGCAANSRLVEAMGTSLAEMDERTTMVGYYAPKGLHEMHDSTPPVQELSSSDSAIHEMFDESVFHEICDEASEIGATTRPRPANERARRPFSWVATPTSAVNGPRLPPYQERKDNIAADSGTVPGPSYALNKKETLEEEQLPEPEVSPKLSVHSPGSVVSLVVASESEEHTL